jgi:hypothetical protein
MVRIESNGMIVGNNDKEIIGAAKDFTNEYYPALDPINQKLIQEIMFNCSKYGKTGQITKDSLAKFKRRFNFFYQQMAQAKTVQEKQHLAGQLVELEKFKRFIGITIEEMKPQRVPSNKETSFNGNLEIGNGENDVIIDQSDLPTSISQFINTLNMPNGNLYIDLVARNVERIFFMEFDENKIFEQYHDAGLSEPVSRSVIINTKTYIMGEQVDAPYWAMASSIVHEAAHIDYEYKHKNDKPSELNDAKAERYAMIMKYKFLEEVLINTKGFKLERSQKAIEATMHAVYGAVQQLNMQLRLNPDDISLK